MIRNENTIVDWMYIVGRYIMYNHYICSTILVMQHNENDMLYSLQMYFLVHLLPIPRLLTNISLIFPDFLIEKIFKIYHYETTIYNNS